MQAEEPPLGGKAAGGVPASAYRRKSQISKLRLYISLKKGQFTTKNNKVSAMAGAAEDTKMEVVQGKQYRTFKTLFKNKRVPNVFIIVLSNNNSVSLR